MEGLRKVRRKFFVLRQIWAREDATDVVDLWPSEPVFGTRHGLSVLQWNSVIRYSRIEQTVGNRPG